MQFQHSNLMPMLGNISPSSVRMVHIRKRTLLLPGVTTVAVCISTATARFTLQPVLAKNASPKFSFALDVPKGISIIRIRTSTAPNQSAVGTARVATIPVHFASIRSQKCQKQENAIRLATAKQTSVTLVPSKIQDPVRRTPYFKQRKSMQ